MYGFKKVVIICSLLASINQANCAVKEKHLVAEPKASIELKQEAEQCDSLLGPVLIAEIESYQDTVNRIIQAATEGDFKGRTYEELSKFVDRFGHRLSGSQSLEDSIDYMIEKMLKDNYTRAWGEEAIVPHWVRGEETAQILTPRNMNLPILGLGTSVGTSAEGLTAEVLVVKDFDDLTANADKAKGKVVVFNQPWVSCAESSDYRRRGANEAAKVGAVAALVRSVTPFSLYTLHTGTQTYGESTDGIPHIPVACITVEDAELLDRMYKRGENVTVFLKMLDYNMPLTTSRNAIGELKGEIYPEEIVIVSGHIDSWDVGKGAIDDGVGCFLSSEAVALINYLGLTPKRSLHAIMWTSEEFWDWGSLDYIRHHKANMPKIIAAFESDGDIFSPLGLDFAGLSDRAGCIIQRILRLTESTLNATTYGRFDYVGADIIYLIDEGVPGITFRMNNSAADEYFYYHHSAADTMSMLDSADLDRRLALWALASYIIADLNDPLPRTLDDPVQPNKSL